ncbi:hypothetical protein J4E91_002800 [Alternaria rosae]|nr:hypothetical protein J4E91_002800 [Alternaria rosae]
MVLCSTCKSLPIRSILRLARSDSDIDEFQWFPLPKSFGNETQPFVKWHNSLSDLQNSASQSCPFCQTIFSRLSNSYHYHTNCKDLDERLWLELGVGSARLSVYMGEKMPTVRLSGKFWYMSTPDSVVADCFREHEIMSDSLHPYVLQKTAAWVSQCDDHHASCRQSTPKATLLPTRLLDLGSLPIGADFKGVRGDPRALLEDTALKLVELPPGSTGRYIALSYCWGQGLPITTTSKNLQKHKGNEGIKYMQLPSTLRDAVFLTRYLGVRYLWADCLCIIQDDKADWEKEASRMADVYSNAYLTTAATRASHCGEGFLQPRKVKDRHVVTFADKEGSFDLYIYYDDLTMSPGSMESIIDQSIKMRREEPLLSRVWVLQERVLARRTIHFASYQMQWECSEQVLTEDGYTEDYKACEEISLERIAQGLKSVKDAPLLQHTQQSQDAEIVRAFNPAWRVWSRLIEEYTSRNMTYQSDKFPALSGVTSALQKLTGDVCLAGIWKSWFLQGLLWRLQDPNWDEYVFFPKTPQRSHPWRAPTWSFASVEGVVVYHLLDHDLGQETYAELLQCDVCPKGVNPLGELKNGFAKIKAPVAEVFDVSPVLSDAGRVCKVRMTNDRHAEGSVWFDVEVHNPCFVLMITPHTGIAIVPVDVAQGTYTRVGAVAVFRIHDPAPEAFRRDNTAFMDRDRSISSSHYPSPKIITLL